jgi:preprotein translocase subunit YajC
MTGWTVWAQAAQAPGGGMTGLFASLFPILMMFVIFYFLLFRPQQRRQAELRKMVENLKKGDRVLTQGGMYGTVVGVNGDTAVLRVADDVKIEFAKSAIVSLVTERK